MLSRGVTLNLNYYSTLINNPNELFAVICSESVCNQCVHIKRQ